MKHLQQFVILTSVMVLMVIASDPLYGQSVGERLRVTLEDSTITGTLASVSQSHFDFVLSDGGSRSVMYSDVKLLERSLGTRTYKKRGFLIGAIPGALLGGVVGLGLVHLCPGLDCPDPSVGKQLGALVTGSIFMGAVSGLPGLVIGALVKREKWETMPTPSASEHLRISPVIEVASIGADRRVVVGTRIRF